MKLIRHIPRERLGYRIYSIGFVTSSRPILWGTFNDNIDSIMYYVRQDATTIING
jgi:hypothetical protein